MDPERAKKMMQLRLLVIGGAALILIAWIFNLKSELRVANETIDREAARDAAELKNEMDSVIDELGEKFEDLGKKNDIASSSEENASSSEALASSSLTGLPEPPSYCPEYINCMPTIGEARPCSIPPGCEEKTIIAY